MTDPSMPVTPSPFFMGAYIALCSLMFLGCLFHAIKVGIYAYHCDENKDDPWLAKIAASFAPAVTLIVFAGAYWVLESFAALRSPYYLYPEFPGAIPQLFPAPPAPATQACAALVRQLQAMDHSTYNMIPSSVLVMEASLTYVAMWTALGLGLGARYYLVPIFAGLLTLNVDVLLDPVVAVVYDCSGKVLRGGSGLGFWHWYTGGVGESLPGWYGVPLFNFAAWWAAPVALVSFVLVLQYLARGKRGQVKTAPVLTNLAAFFLVVGVVGAFYVVNLFAPHGSLPIWVHWALIAAMVLGSWGLILWHTVLGRWVFIRRKRVWRGEVLKSAGRVDPWLVLPPLVLIAVALLGLLINGIFLDLPTLLPVGLVAVVFALLLVLWPYEDTVCAIARGMVDLDRYVRLHYFSYTSTLILLGGFAAGIFRGKEGLFGDNLLWLVGSLVATAACFQTYAYVLNDVIDLDLDKTQENRRRDPLVRGRVHWMSAFALALVQIPTALLFIFMAGGPWPAYVALLSGFALMTVYNLWGKVGPFPPLTDAVQALAWGSLVWVGAFTAGESSKLTTRWAIVWAVFIFGALFIFLINGIHGGLRDLRNDVDKKRKTTAWLLGAHSVGAQVRSTWKVAAFAFSVHTLMFVGPLALLLLDPLGFGGTDDGWVARETRVRLAAIIVILTFLVSSYYLWRVVKPVNPDRDEHMQWHVFLVLLPLVIGGLPFLDLTSAMILLVAFFGPLLAMENAVDGFIRLTRPNRQDLRDRVLSSPSRLHAGTEEQLADGEHRQRRVVNL